LVISTVLPDVVELGGGRQGNVVGSVALPARTGSGNTGKDAGCGKQGNEHPETSWCCFLLTFVELEFPDADL